MRGSGLTVHSSNKASGPKAKQAQLDSPRIDPRKTASSPAFHCLQEATPGPKSLGCEDIQAQDSEFSLLAVCRGEGPRVCARGCHRAVGGLCLRCLFWRHFLEILLVRQKPQRGRTAARSCPAGSWITVRQKIKSQEPRARSSVLLAQRAITPRPRRQPITPGSLREQGSGLVGQPPGNLTWSRPSGG